MTNTPAQALAAAAAQSAHGPAFGANECQMRARLLYGIPSDGTPTAAAWWAKSTHKHATSDPSTAPAGALHYFTGGSSGAGHVMISRGGSPSWSTDIARTGYYDQTTVEALLAKWTALRYVGWTTDIDGVVFMDATTPEVPVAATTYGIDASHFQFDDGFNLQLAKDQGYEFVLLKCTQGTGWFDKTFPAARAKAQSLGLLVAAYHFLEAGNGAAQAANIAAHIGDKSIPVAIDIEPTGSSKPTKDDWVAFSHACQALGLKVTLKYLNESYWSSIGSPSLAGPLALWRAKYPSSRVDYGSRLYPGNTASEWAAFGSQVPTLWQFASSGKLDGYSGTVDVNAFRGTRADLAKLGLFKDYATPIPPPPPKPPVAVTTQTHLQLNVQKSMSQAHITTDLEKAFGLGADTIAFQEMETDWHHTEAERIAAASGYSLFSPTGAAARAVVIAVKDATATIVYSKSLLCALGMAGLSPNRYFNRVQIQRNDTGALVAVGGTQMWSSGWTGSTSNDAIRQARWYAHMAIMFPAFRRTAKFNVVSIGSGDMNRPPASFPAGGVLGRMLSTKGMKSAGYAHTDGTHGTTIFDYVWWISAQKNVHVDSWSTPSFNSDHDGVLVQFSWPS